MQFMLLVDNIDSTPFSSRKVSYVPVRYRITRFDIPHSVTGPKSSVHKVIELVCVSLHLY